MIQAVYRVFILDITVGGRFWRRIGLKSSGPAALSFLNELMAKEISLSEIQGILVRVMAGERGGRGGLVCRVTREVFIYQGFKGSCGGGGDRAIREFHVAYAVRIKFLLYYFRQKRC